MENSRRGFMGKVLGVVAGVGAIGALYPMKRTWDPLPSVKAAGFTTVDLSELEEGVLAIEKWRGKPIFMLKKSAATVSAQTAEQTARDVVVDGQHYLIAIALCTHLGCIPAFSEAKKGFLCACHGGEFDISGIDTKAPPPSPLEIPPFKIAGSTVVLGETGPEYEKMKEAGVLA